MLPCISPAYLMRVSAPQARVGFPLIVSWADGWRSAFQHLAALTGDCQHSGPLT